MPAPGIGELSRHRANWQPAWLIGDSPNSDVAISSRVRYARNIAGHPFPHNCATQDLVAVERSLRNAIRASGVSVERLHNVSAEDRHLLLGSRLISPVFDLELPGRSLYVSPDRQLSIMVNEEDHFRLQAITAGWSIQTARVAADQTLEAISARVRFMRTEHEGYLTASPFNGGGGRRLSAMLHLIGLATTRRLPGVLRALADRVIHCRGVYGETSRAAGAFFQVSTTEGGNSTFAGACEYLMLAERAARAHISAAQLEEYAQTAMRFATTSRSIGLAESFRALAWLRWAASSEVGRLNFTHRDVDSWLSLLQVLESIQGPRRGIERAALLRSLLEQRT